MELYEKGTTSHLDPEAMWRLLKHCGWKSIRKPVKNGDDIYYYVQPKFTKLYATYIGVEKMLRIGRDYCSEKHHCYVYITDKVMQHK